MSIKDEIDRIEKNISESFDEAEAKGATVPAEKNSDNLPTTIASIPTGGGTPTPTIADILTAGDRPLPHQRIFFESGNSSTSINATQGINVVTQGTSISMNGQTGIIDNARPVLSANPTRVLNDTHRETLRSSTHLDIYSKQEIDDKLAGLGGGGTPSVTVVGADENIANIRTPGIYVSHGLVNNLQARLGVMDSRADIPFNAQFIMEVIPINADGSLVMQRINVRNVATGTNQTTTVLFRFSTSATEWGRWSWTNTQQSAGASP